MVQTNSLRARAHAPGASPPPPTQQSFFSPGPVLPHLSVLWVFRQACGICSFELPSEPGLATAFELVPLLKGPFIKMGRNACWKSHAIAWLVPWHQRSSLLPWYVFGSIDSSHNVQNPLSFHLVLVGSEPDSQFMDYDHIQYMVVFYPPKNHRPTGVLNTANLPNPSMFHPLNTQPTIIYRSCPQIFWMISPWKCR